MALSVPGRYDFRLVEVRGSKTSSVGAAALHRHEPLGIAAAAVTLLFVLSLVSYEETGGADWVGPVGHAVAGFFVGAFGLGAIWFALELAIASKASSVESSSLN